MKKRTRIFKVLIVILISFLVWVFAAPFLAKSLIVEKPLLKADAILVLGGSSVYIERTQKAALLYKQGVAPKVFLTDDGGKAGWSQIEKRNPPFVELAKKELIAQGVPADTIEILQPQVSGTFSEVEVLLEKTRKDNLKSFVIVTSAYHTRRALRIFEKVFAGQNLQTEIGISPALTGQQTPTLSAWRLSPKDWKFVAEEYVKTLGYWIYY